MRAVLCGAALALSACTYYVMPDGNTVPAGSPSPSNFDRTFAAAAQAMRDQGLAISVEDRARGSVVGSIGGGMVTANVRPQPDGSVRTQFDARNVSDPGLLQRVSDSYDRRLGR
jgi:hypothetical protein